MINEQAELRVSNVISEGKEMQLIFFFGLDLPPLHLVIETILIFCCNEVSSFIRQPKCGSIHSP